MFILGKKSVGIDIADRSIEAVELSDSNGSIKVTATGRAPLKPGIVERGEIKDEAALEAAVKAVLEGASPKPIKTKKIIFGLPESRLYSHLFDLPKKRRKSITALVEEEAVNNFPIRRDDLTYAFKAIEEAGKGNAEYTRMLLIGASKELMASWQKFFEKLDIEIEKFDSEALAISRGLAKEKAKAPISIIDIGAAVTTISIFNGKGLYYSHTFNQAGDELTRQLADFRKKPDGSKIDLEEAERLKIEYGISETDDDHKEVARVLKIALSPIAEETRTAFKYFFEKTGIKVEQVALVGGTAQLKGIAEYFSADIGSPASIGKPALETAGDQSFFPEAIGLAMRSFAGEWDKTDPFLEPIKSAAKIEIASEKIEAPADEPDPDAKPSLYATHPKEIQLVLILILGVALIGGAFWYRDYSAKKRHQNANREINNAYAYAQSLPFEVNINVGTSTLSAGEIRGRVVRETITKGASYEEALAASKEAAVSQLKKGESVWKEPVNAPRADGKILFPLDFDWLIYPESPVTDIGISEAKKNFGNKSDFILENVLTLSLNSAPAGTSTHIYILSAKINVMTKNAPAASGSAPERAKETAVATATIEAAPAIEAATSTQAESEKETEASSTPVTESATTTVPALPAATTFADKMAEILKAAREQASSGVQVEINADLTAPVNIRAGAGTDFPVLKKANPGEKFTLVEEQEGWIEIKLSDTEYGWVASDFAQALRN